MARRASPPFSGLSPPPPTHPSGPGQLLCPPVCLLLPSWVSVTPPTLTSVSCAPLICLGNEGWEVGVGGGSAQTDPGSASYKSQGPPSLHPCPHPRKSSLAGEPRPNSHPQVLSQLCLHSCPPRLQLTWLSPQPDLLCQQPHGHQRPHPHRQLPAADGPLQAASGPAANGHLPEQ